MSLGGTSRVGRSRRLSHQQYMARFEKLLANLYSYSQYKPEEKKPKEAGPDDLLVKKVDLDVEANTTAHRTSEFDITNASVYDTRENLVIRRGQDFKFKVQFNRKFNAMKDDLRLIFEFGNKSSEIKDSKVEFDLSAKDVPKEWGAYVVSEADDWLTIVITTPPTCAVGKWKLKIDVVKKKSSDKSVVFSYVHKDPLYLLFNPWCKDDEVYMENEKALDEYVLAETGSLYKGSSGQIASLPWNFGQFSGNVLDGIIDLLDEKSNLSDLARGNAVLVTRAISSLVNSCDNDGILAGNWSGDYSGGQKPTSWTGSVAILQSYYKNKETVLYGQCWVFSAVVTTVCRALGIPTRSVTNFSSAHDKDESMTIDRVIDYRTFTMVDELCDSVWNFHVWNDVWMSRPDLPKGYGGWQAIDATPQETSEGIYCMGPTSVAAIKQGDVYLNYDGKFLFAEVNGDQITWYLKNGKLQKSMTSRNKVGKCISTRRAFGTASREELDVCPDKMREDITLQYKFPERSREEAAAVHKANQYSSRQGVYVTTAEDVQFELQYDKANTFIGMPIELQMNVTNTSSAVRTVHGTINVSTMYYTGVLHQVIHTEKLDETQLKGKDSITIKMGIPETTYLDKLVDECMFCVTSIFMVDETSQIYTETKDMRLRKPHLLIEAPDRGKVQKKFNVKVSFVNPLSVKLTDCNVVIEGPGKQEPVTVKQRDVGAGKTFEYQFELTPVKPGKKDIIVSFDCRQIYAVNATHSMKIRK